MKKFLTILLLALVGMNTTSCEKSGVEEPNNNIEQPNDEDNKGNDNDNENESDVPENLFFVLDKESVTIASDGGSVDVIVYSNYKWEISGVSDWCTPSVKNGSANEDGQKVSFYADLTYDSREATFWFRCADEKIKLVVSQKLKEVINPDGDNTFDIPVEGGIAVISYQTSVDCEVIIPEEAQSWVSIANSRALVSESISLDVAANTTYSDRTVVVKVVAKYNDNLVVKYTINQEQKDAILADENNTFIVPGEGGDVQIDYLANVDCEIIIPEEVQNWITFVPETRGLVTKSATLRIAENTTYSDRTAVVMVVAKDNDNLAVEYTINQEQNDAVFADGDNTFTVPSKGGDVEIDYLANVDCEIIIPKEAQDWVAIVPETRGLVADTATLHVAENTTYSDRTAVVRMMAKDNDNWVVEYTINQKQKDAIIADGGNEFNIDGHEQQISIKHKTNIDCEVVIPAEAQDWITIAPATRGLETYTTTLNIAANDTGVQRQAIVKVVSVDNNELFAEYTISQEFRYLIKYTSTDGRIVEPYSSSAFDALILSNTYDNGVGIIEFSSPITTIGELAFYECESLTSITIPNSVTTIENRVFWGCGSLTSVTIGDNVTKIGNSAFNGCFNLTSVTIPDSVTLIGECAFDGCFNLTSVTIPDSVTSIGECAFRGCSGLTSVIIGNSVTTIRDSTFDGCSSLASVTIGDSVITIEERAFIDCVSLMSVTIPDSVTTIGERAFSNCDSLTSVTIGDSVTTIEDYAFSCCGSLISVTIGENVIMIGEWAFSYCGSLTSVTIPDSVTMIGECAFYKCGGLESVTIGDGVRTIGNSAFKYCSCLTNVTFGDSVTGIGDEAFCQCDSLTSVIIPDSVIVIGEQAFYDCSSLTNIVIGDGVTEIRNMAFWGCSSLASVTIGDNVTEIGNRAFYNCDRLTSVTVPDSVTMIADEAFFSCDGLTRVTIGDGVTSIGKCAFYSCDNLISVTIGDSVNVIADDAFSYCTGELIINSNIVTKNYSSSNEPTWLEETKFTSIIIGDGITSIGDYTFSDCESLTSVTIPNSITRIGNYAFTGCSSLRSVHISDIAAWYDILFYNNSANPLNCRASLYVNNELVTDLIVPDGITTIKDYAFCECCSLTSVTIPDSVTSIGKRAFWSCNNLTSATIGDRIKRIDIEAFEDCHSLISITIPDSVTWIGESAFRNCSSLTSVYISDIAAWCDITFYTYYANPLNNGASLYLNNELVTDLIIPDGITTIKKYAFYGCNNLTSVTFPDSVTTIEDYTFDGCSSITSLYFKSLTPPSIVSTVFDEIALDFKIYVPTEAVRKYKNRWYHYADYADRIVGYDF